MRNLKGLAAASVAMMLAASCTPVHANPSKEDHEFCTMTADLAFNSIIMKRQGKVSLEDTLKAAQDLFAYFPGVFSAKQEAAVLRSIRFGYGAPDIATPHEIARYQYVGCLATEI